MPSVAVKLYNVFFKFLLKHRLQIRIQASLDDSEPFGVRSLPEESASEANPSFTDGVATKDIQINPFTSLSVQIFLLESALYSPDSNSWKPKPGVLSKCLDLDARLDLDYVDAQIPRSNSYGTMGNPDALVVKDLLRRNSFVCANEAGSLSLKSKSETGGYRGSSPVLKIH